MLYAGLDTCPCPISHEHRPRYSFGVVVTQLVVEHCRGLAAEAQQECFWAGGVKSQGRLCRTTGPVCAFTAEALGRVRASSGPNRTTQVKGVVQQVTIRCSSNKCYTILDSIQHKQCAHTHTYIYIHTQSCTHILHTHIDLSIYIYIHTDAHTHTKDIHTYFIPDRPQFPSLPY